MNAQPLPKPEGSPSCDESRAAPAPMSAGDPTAGAPWSLRRAAIIGAGAMGTILASALGQSIPVLMVCRDPQRAAWLFEHGARMEGLISGSARPIIVSSVDDLVAAGGADAVFIATKTTAIPAVARALEPVLPHLADEVFVVSSQNGVKPGRQLQALLHTERVLRLVVTLGAVYDRGVSRITLDLPPHVIGGPLPYRRASEIIAGALTGGGVTTVHRDDIERWVWQKAVVNAAVNPVAALVNCTVGDVLDSPASVIVDRLLAEGIRVGEREGIELAGFAEKIGPLLEHARSHVPSMVEDIRKGRESEVGQLNRQIIESGRELGVPTPTHETIDALIETFDWKIYHGSDDTDDAG